MRKKSQQTASSKTFDAVSQTQVAEVDSHLRRNDRNRTHNEIDGLTRRKRFVIETFDDIFL